MTEARLHRESVEVLIQSSGSARLHRESIEALIQTVGPARLHRESIEALIQTVGPARLHRETLEVLRPTEDGWFRWGAELEFGPVFPSGLVLDLDADVSPMFQTSGGSAAIANNDPVGVWRDAVAGHDAAQTTSGARPLLKLGVYNGHSCIRFDGSDDQLILPGDASEQVVNITLFIVANSTAGGGRSMIAKSHTATGWSNPFARWIIYNDGSYNTRWNGVNVAQGSWSNGDLKVIEYVDADVYANGTKVVDATDADLTYPNGTTPILISGNGVGSERFAGDICRILIWNRSLDATERAQVRQGLGLMYGVTVV